MAISWGGSVDDLVASWWRPLVGTVSGFTLCACALMFADTRALTISLLAGLAGGAGVLRTLDKQTTAGVTKAQMTAPSPTPAPTVTPQAKVGG